MTLVPSSDELESMAATATTNVFPCATVAYAAGTCPCIEQTTEFPQMPMAEEKINDEEKSISTVAVAPVAVMVLVIVARVPRMFFSNSFGPCTLFSTTESSILLNVPSLSSRTNV